MSTTQDTPRTDRKEYDVNGENHVDPDFARELERENEALAEKHDRLRVDRDRLALLVTRYEDANAQLRSEVGRYIAHNGMLRSELESHAWEISPAMAQARIDQLNAEIERWRASVNTLRTEMEHQSLRANTAEAEISRLNSLLSGRPLAMEVQP
jgi:chromosome segregation ATPase